MTNRQDCDLAVELHDVFKVLQVTRDTIIEQEVGVDLVEMDPDQTSNVHRHNFSETVLYFLEGTATVEVSGADFPVSAGDRIRIGRGEFHGVRTGADGCRFVSVQTPPILSKATGFRDLEPRDA